jgi:4-hydroxy-3-methylbut-2-enyl diphosphate reductase
MQVIKIKPRGYCEGVTRALNLVNKVIENNPDKAIYLLGMIVNNRLVNQALENKNVTLLSDSKTKEEWIDDIDSGIIIISAHGVSPQIIDKALSKGLEVVDATCEYVSRIQKSVISFLSDGYDIIYIGESNHPESQGVINIQPNNIHLVNSIQQVKKLNLSNDKIFVTTQTTMNYQQTEELLSAIKKRFSNVEISNRICDATYLRQSALENLQENLDLLLVVGDEYSNNAKKLMEIGINKKIPEVKLIHSVVDLSDYDFSATEVIGITSAASTPTYLTNQVIEYIANYPKSEIQPIDINKIL